MGKRSGLVCALGIALALASGSATAAVHDAADVSTFPVVGRGPLEIEIDLEFDDWRLANETLFAGGDTWEALGGTWDGDDDLSATLQVVWEPAGLFFKLIVTDDEYVHEGGNPWENDGIQMAIDASAGEVPAGAVPPTTHLYNFGIADGWIAEAGDFQGEAEIMMDRDDAATENQFEWYMPVEIFAEDGTELSAGMEIAFAFIANDSDPGAEGQTGWIGWGPNTIVHGKNPEEMQTLELMSDVLAVDAGGKLATAWSTLKR
jgi:hypothetical protein